MKGSVKIIMVTGVMTAMLLLYVHLQVSLFQVSYDLTSLSDSVAKKSEEYRHLKFDVDQLRAPRRLEREMTSLSLNLTLPKNVEVVRVNPPLPMDVAQTTDMHISSLPDRFMNYLGRWVGVAQAKTDN